MEYCYILILSLFICSCVSKQTDRIEQFYETVNLTVSDSIYSDKELPMGPVLSIKSWRNVLILSHHSDNYRFSFIDSRTGRLVARWGEKGNSPSEFIDFGSDFFVQDSLLIFQSSMKKTMNYISIPAIALVKTESYPYTADFRPLQIMPMGEKKVATGLFSHGVLGLLDENNQIVGTFSCDLDGLYRGTVYQLILSCNVHKKRLLVSVSHSDVFEIYELQANGLQRVYVNNFSRVPIVKMQDGRLDIDDSQSIGGILSMFNTEDLFYLGYSNSGLVEVARKDYMFDEILCFD